MDDGYERIYYQTIRDLRIDPVVGPEGCIESGSVDTADRPVQLAAKAVAKATEGSPRVPRKRAARKATAAPAEGSDAEASSGPTLRAVPKQAATKTTRGTAKVASSG